MVMIIAGIEESLRGQDAVALAGEIAVASGAGVLAVCAYPYDESPAAHYNLSMRALLRESAEETLGRLCTPLTTMTTVHRRTIADVAPARALITAATEAQAALIVVGSSHAGFSGQVLPGSTGTHLLDGAPCSVAIAPQGYRLRPLRSRGHGRVTVAFDGSPTAHAALRAGDQFARAAGRSLRVVTVFPPDVVTPTWLHVPPGYLRVPEDARKAARDELERVVAATPGAEAVFLVGDPAEELARESETAELLVVGSRNYGPVPAVLLGDVSCRLVATASCPVLVVPHGIDAPLDRLFADCGQLRTEIAA
jgi:nucleotide-binding universal stress UspA family protein